MQKLGNNLTGIVHVFQGDLTVNGHAPVAQGQSVCFQGHSVLLLSNTSAELVQFSTGELSDFYDGGMFSGNHYKNNKHLYK